MKRYGNLVASLVIIALILMGATTAPAQPPELVEAADGSGIVGYRHTPRQPWSEYHVHDPDRPAPPIVDPGSIGLPTGVPSDAIVLFDGSDLDAWRPNEWKIEDGCLISTRGPMVTQEEFGDLQLHLQYLVPEEPSASFWDRGNNGVFFMGAIEVQIFDSHASHEQQIYADGQAAAIYGQTPPRVNACLPPGEWQTYDIVFLAPRFDDQGNLTAPARITMYHNGVLVHLNQEVYGNTAHLRLGSYEGLSSRGPISLGAHRSPVRFRNIWVRPL